MTRVFESFRNKVASEVAKRPGCEGSVCCDIKLSLGLLLWAMGAVAGADGAFSAEEENKISEILTSCAGIEKRDMPVVMATVKQASIGKIDPFRLIADAGSGLNEHTRSYIIETLFRIAYADNRLDPRELEAIKRAAELFEMPRDLFDSIQKSVEDSMK